MNKRRLLIAGNWKMNGLKGQLGEIEAIGGLAADRADIDIALFLPATLIAAASGAAGSTLTIGGQDCHAAENGAFTGSISAAMLIEAGATSTLVGHSERRSHQNENSADCALKAARAHGSGLSVILCIGESLDIREAGDAEVWVVAQLQASLPDGAAGDWLSIAYEPVWAIGTGKVATPDQVDAMHRAIRAGLRERLGDGADAMRILYGGSVTGENAAELLALADVDGVLVGGASLTAVKFAPIIAAATQ